MIKFNEFEFIFYLLFQTIILFSPIYTMNYYSAIKKNEIMPFVATWMDLEIIILSEVSQRKTDTISLICGIQKKWYKWVDQQNRSRLTDLENKL